MWTCGGRPEPKERRVARREPREERCMASGEARPAAGNRRAAESAAWCAVGERAARVLSVCEIEQCLQHRSRLAALSLLLLPALRAEAPPFVSGVVCCSGAALGSGRPTTRGAGVDDDLACMAAQVTLARALWVACHAKRVCKAPAQRNATVHEGAYSAPCAATERSRRDGAL